MTYRTKLITAAVSAAAISLLLSLPAASQSIIKIGSPTIKLPPTDEAEFRKRMSTVGDAVMKDKPEVREMCELMKKIAARHLNG